MYYAATSETALAVARAAGRAPDTAPQHQEKPATGEIAALLVHADATADRVLVELDAARQAAQSRIDAFEAEYRASGRDWPEEEFNDLCSVAADAEAEIIRTPATTLRGLLIKARVAANVAVTHHTSDPVSPLASPDAAYSNALSDDSDYYPLDDTVALLTLWADLQRAADAAGLNAEQRPA